MILRTFVPTSPGPGGRPLRLDMAAGGDDAALDGAWWPYSRDLAAELPPLIAGLDGWLDATAPVHGPHVGRISINSALWDAVPAHVDRTGRRVRLSWYGAVDAHTLSATCSDGSHLDLLVVPPQAEVDQARAAATAATDPNNTRCSATILAGLMPDPLHGDGAERRADRGDQEAWDRVPGGPVHLLDDGDPEEVGPDLATAPRVARPGPRAPTA